MTFDGSEAQRAGIRQPSPSEAQGWVDAFHTDARPNGPKLAQSPIESQSFRLGIPAGKIAHSDQAKRGPGLEIIQRTSFGPLGLGNRVRTSTQPCASLGLGYRVAALWA